jgi:hypothetical protein
MKKILFSRFQRKLIKFTKKYLISATDVHDKNKKVKKLEGAFEDIMFKKLIQ